MRRIIAQARKEVTQVMRDRLTLALALILPLALLALMGTAISLSVTDLPIVVQDLDNTPESRKFIDAFRSSLTFRLVGLPVDEQPEEALLDNEARGALIIPQHFERDLIRGETTEIQFLVDASDANTANIMRGAANAVTQNFVKTLRSNVISPIKANVRLWFNPGRESDKYIAPSMLAVGLSLFPLLLAALAMSREGEQKTILQVYVSSISAHEYLLGKILAYFLISLAEWFLSLLLVFFLFGLYLRGDPTPLLVSTVIYLFCTVSFGAMVGAAIPESDGGNSSRSACRIFTFVFAFGRDISRCKYPKSLEYNILRYSGAVLYRSRERCFGARRRLVGRVACAVRFGGDRVVFLFDRMEKYAENADRGMILHSSRPYFVQASAFMVIFLFDRMEKYAENADRGIK